MGGPGTSSVLDERRTPDRRRRADLRWAALAGAAATVVFLVCRGALIDDAYITLSYARNLAEHLHWGLTPFRTANSATSPLNVLLLAAATVVVRDAVWALGVVFVLLTAAQGWGLSRLARDLRLGTPTVVLGVLLLLLSPLMLSIVGMEMTLGVTLVVWLAVAAAEGRAVLFALVAAGLVLTRVDLGVFPLVLLLATPGVRRRTGRVLAVAAAAVVPWFGFSWVVLGGLFPDTLVIKTAAGAAWGPWDFGNGPRLYWASYPAAVLLTAAPVVVGSGLLVAWAAGRAWRRPRWAGLGVGAALGVAGLLHFAAYSLLGPPPYHWYYAPSVAALTLVVAMAAGTPGRAARVSAATTSPRSSRPWADVVVAVAALLVVADLGLAVDRRLPWEEAPITTNWATAGEYRTLGEELTARLDGQTVGSPGEIGTIAYYCRCDVVDQFSDRGRVQPLIDQRIAEGGPLVRLVLRVDFAHLARVPATVPTQQLVWVGGPDARSAPWPAHSTWRGPGAFDLVPAG